MHALSSVQSSVWSAGAAGQHGGRTHRTCTWPLVLTCTSAVVRTSHQHTLQMGYQSPAVQAIHWCSTSDIMCCMRTQWDCVVSCRCARRTNCSLLRAAMWPRAWLERQKLRCLTNWHGAHQQCKSDEHIIKYVCHQVLARWHTAQPTHRMAPTSLSQTCKHTCMTSDLAADVPQSVVLQKPVQA